MLPVTLALLDSACVQYQGLAAQLLLDRIAPTIQLCLNARAVLLYVHLGRHNKNERETGMLIHLKNS